MRHYVTLLAVLTVGCGAAQGKSDPVDPENGDEPVGAAQAGMGGSRGNASDQEPVASGDGEPVQDDMVQDARDEPVQDEMAQDEVVEDEPVHNCPETGYPGDDLCPGPVDPGEGFQIHFGPSDYDDPDEVAKYVLEPGGEALKCQYVTTPNDEEIFYVDWLNTLRPSSHHMIINLGDPNVPDGYGDCNQGAATFAAGLVGGNSTEVSAFEQRAPENEGIARTIPPHAKIEMQLHFFNPTQEPLLMEAWQNIYYFDPDQVKEVAGTIFGIAGLRMNIQPGEGAVIAGRMVAPSGLRILSLTGHNHNHTLRFSAYVERGGDRTLVYESYDWEHPAYLAYDSVHDNAPPDGELLVPGGYKGLLELAAGDALSWECEMVNDDLSIPLTYANRALDAEMCNLHGLYTPSIGAGGWNAFLP